MRILMRLFYDRIDSFKYALGGLKDMLSTEHNACVHAVFTVVVIPLAIWLRLPFVNFVLIVIAITLVWVAEAFNTVLEILVNMVSPRYSKVAKRAKDIAAAAVLIAAVGAFIIGVLLLGPPLLAKNPF